MSKKNQEEKTKIIETEPVVIDEKDIITEEVPAEDTIEVEAPEVIIENSDGDVKTDAPSVEAPEVEPKEEPKEEKFKLKVNIGFCDKYTNVDYEVGDIVEFEKDRYDELLKDERKLVSKVK